MSIFLVLLEESDADDTRRDMHSFSSVEACHEFFMNYVADLKHYEWANNLRPPRPPSISKLLSMKEDKLETIYTFEYQTPGQEFFCIELFVKRLSQ